MKDMAEEQAGRRAPINPHPRPRIGKTARDRARRMRQEATTQPHKGSKGKP